MSAATRVAPPRRRLDRSRMVRACSVSRRARRRLRSCGQGRSAEQRRGRVRIAARRKAPQIVRRDRQGLLAAARPFEVSHLAAERFGHVPAAGGFFEVALVPAEGARRALGRLVLSRPSRNAASAARGDPGNRRRWAKSARRASSSLPMKRAASASAARSSPSADSSTRARPRRWASATTRAARPAARSACHCRGGGGGSRSPVVITACRIARARRRPCDRRARSARLVDRPARRRRRRRRWLLRRGRRPSIASAFSFVTESDGERLTGAKDDLSPGDRPRHGDDPALHAQIEAFTRRVPGHRKRGAVDPHFERPRLEQPARVLAVLDVDVRSPLVQSDAPAATIESAIRPRARGSIRIRVPSENSTSVPPPSAAPSTSSPCRSEGPPPTR